MTVPQLQRHECSLAVRLPPQRAELLALLLVTPPDRFVGLEEVAETLWPDPDKQPEDVANIVRTHVCALRRAGVTIESRVRTNQGRDGFGAYRIPLEARAL